MLDDFIQPFWWEMTNSIGFFKFLEIGLSLYAHWQMLMDSTPPSQWKTGKEKIIG